MANFGKGEVGESEFEKNEPNSALWRNTLRKPILRSGSEDMANFEDWKWAKWVLKKRTQLGGVGTRGRGLKKQTQSWLRRARMPGFEKTKPIS
jgi:hypothetical protein